MTALLANPGPDGISLREVLEATNKAPGVYTIRFAPQLKGATIRVGDLPPLLGGNVIVNGDIDGDGTPDVALEGSFYGFRIASGGNTLHAVELRNFLVGVDFKPVSADNTFANNVVANLRMKNIQGAGIGHLLSQAEALAAPRNRWVNTLIVGNTIESAVGGVLLHLSSLENSLEQTTIIDNTILIAEGRRGGNGINVHAGLGAGARGNRQVDTLIARNVIVAGGTAEGMGIQVSAGGLSGSADGVRILENRIRMNPGADHHGIQIGTEEVEYYYPEDNVFRNAWVVGNVIEGPDNIGIDISRAAGARNTVRDVFVLGNRVNIGPSDPNFGTYGIRLVSGSIGRTAATENDVSNIFVRWNTLRLTSPTPHFHSAGIMVSGGQFRAVNSQVRDSVISHNDVDSGEVIGINIFGGWQGASNNTVSRLDVYCNRVAAHPTYPWITQFGTKGITVSGGFFNASANRVEQLRLADNLVAGVLNDFSVQDNVGDGASGNTVELASTEETLPSVSIARNRSVYGAGDRRVVTLPAVAGSSSDPLDGSAQSLPDPLRLSIDFNGVDQVFGGMPPAITIAAGPLSLVLSSNESVTIRDKSGSQIAAAELDRFFSSVNTERERLLNPTVYFDPGSYRFFLAASGAYRDDNNCRLGTCVGHVFLAVSRNDNPTSTEGRDWYFYALDATIEAGVRTANFPDQTRVAADDRIVVIVSTQFRFADHGDLHPMIRILDKSQVISGVAVTWSDFVGMLDPDGHRAQQFMPVHALERPATGTTFLINPRGCDFGVWGIEDARVSPRLVYRLAQASPRPEYRWCAQPPDTLQPGGGPPLRLADVPTLQFGPVYRNGSIWAVEHIRMNYGSGDVSAIRWVQIDISKWPDSVSIVQDATLGTDGIWFFSPALTVDPSNNVAIVYGRSSSSEFPSAYYTGRLSTDRPNTLRPSLLLKAGEASQDHWTGNDNGRQMYGDYFGASLDPVNQSAWIIGEYVKTAERWGTWVGNIRFTR